jgi:hypothetical protein
MGIMGNKTQREDVPCDRCYRPVVFSNSGGYCEACGENLCASCTDWQGIVCHECHDLLKDCSPEELRLKMLQSRIRGLKSV